MQLRLTLASIILVAMSTHSSVSSADAVLDWNRVALECIAESKQLPPAASRAITMMHVAMFDAVNAIEHRYKPYSFVGRAPSDASAESAAIAAASGVLVKLYPKQRIAIEAKYASSLQRIPDGAAKTRGIALGVKVAEGMLTLRSNDGASAPNRYRPRTTPGIYVPTTIPAATEWPRVKPWLLDNGEQLRPGVPPALSSREWAQDYNESKSIGAKDSATRTAEQTDVARFWEITGPAAWNPVVQSLAQSRSSTLLENARLFALTNLAAADALIAVFDGKYAYHLWRPITAIRNGDADGNDATQLDATWLPLLETPMHPEYPCAHCITASAVGAVLEAQFGKGEVPPFSMTSAATPGIIRRWTRIGDYVEEVSNARVWGGIHYRSSTEVGEQMGQAIASLAIQKLFTPIQ